MEVWSSDGKIMEFDPKSLMYGRNCSTLVNTQYRSNPQLYSSTSQQFYEGKVMSGVTRAQKPIPQGYPFPVKKVPEVIELNDSEETKTTGGSCTNKAEAARAIEIVCGLILYEGPGKIKPEEIVILSPYAAQVELITELINER